jgi:hypothetical protein
MVTDITIQFNFTEGDYVKLIRSHQLRSVFTTQTAFNFLIFLILAGFLDVVVRMGPAAYAVVGGALLVAIPFFYFVSPHLYFRRNPEFKDLCTITFTEEGLTVKSTKVESTVKWNYYHSVIITKAGYILSPQKSSGIMIPRRAFTESQQVAVEELLKRKLVQR